MTVIVLAVLYWPFRLVKMSVDNKIELAQNVQVTLPLENSAHDHHARTGVNTKFSIGIIMHFS